MVQLGEKYKEFNSVMMLENPPSGAMCFQGILGAPSTKWARTSYLIEFDNELQLRSWACTF